MSTGSTKQQSLPLYTVSSANGVLQLIIILVLLLFAYVYNFLLFHTLAEIISALICFIIFTVAWNARRYLTNPFFTLVGIGLLFTGVLQLIHSLLYQGVSIILPNGDANFATQFWIFSRYFLAAALLFGSLLLRVRMSARHIRWTVVFSVCLGLFVAGLIVLYYQNFPAAYVEGIGLTLFKRISEYIISAALVAAFIIFRTKRERFGSMVSQLVLWSLFFFIASELIFTLYHKVTDLFNVIGHLFEVSGFYLIYLALAQIAISRPFQALFKDVHDAQQRLAGQKEYVEQIINSTSDGIVAFDRQYRVTRWNPGMERLFGIAAPAALGKSVFEVLPFPTPELREKLQRVFQGTSEEFTNQPYVIRPSNRHGFINGHYTPIKDKSGTISGGLFMAWDTTEQIEHEQQMKSHTAKLELLTGELRKFQMAVDQAQDYIIITDTNFHITYANHAISDNTGFAQWEMEGRTPRELWTCAPTAEQYGKIWDVAYRAPYFGEVTLVKKSGDTIICTVHISPVIDRQRHVLFYIIIFEDVSEEREIERAKDEFVSLASHQLRTPLASISLATDLLLRRDTVRADPQIARRLGEISTSTEWMTALISTLLNVSRIEMGTFTFSYHRIDLTDKLKRIVHSFDQEVKENKLTLRTDYTESSPVIRSDRNALRIIFENLISNAIRYTPAGGTITVSLTTQGQQSVITVADTGIGIPPHEQEKVFTKSYRSTLAKKKVPDGTGLGLYLVYKLVLRLGGSIGFTSTEGRGTVFTVTLPPDSESIQRNVTTAH